MIEINLVPDIKQELIKAQKIRSKVILFSILIGIVSVGIVTVLAIGVFIVQPVRSTINDNAIKQGSEELSSVEDLSKTLTIQNQLTKISNLNADKKIDSRIFAILSAIIPPSPNNIKVSNLTIDSDAGNITIQGQASNSYAAVEVFKKTIEGAKIKYTDENDDQQEVILASNISTSDMSYGEDTSGAKVLRFSISFDYADETFSPGSSNLSFIITTDGNATDSYIGVPKSIFVDRAKDLTEEQ